MGISLSIHTEKHISHSTKSTMPSAASHPTYRVMVSEAIKALKNRKGSSRAAIASHVNAAYPGLKNDKYNLRITLSKGVADGVFVQDKQSFKLAAPVKAAKPAAKKPAKKAVKKPAKKAPAKKKVVKKPAKKAPAKKKVAKKAPAKKAKKAKK